MVVKKAQLRLHFLRVLRKNNLQKKLTVTFYRAAIESILGYCITAWYAGCLTADRNRCNGSSAPSRRSLAALEDIANSCYLSGAGNIIKNSSHPSNHLFELAAVWPTVQVAEEQN